MIVVRAFNNVAISYNMPTMTTVLPPSLNGLRGVACALLKNARGRTDNVNELPRFEYRVVLLLAILILVLVHAS
jgi:hypothetical protein